jgi:hypothetical protein
MAFNRYASNGTVRAVGSEGGQGSRIAQATDISVTGQKNSEIVMTTSGEGGSTDGFATVKITGKCAVKRNSTERKTLMRKYQAGEPLVLVYRSGDMEYSAEGVLQGFTLTSSTNKKDEFDFEFEGIEQPIRDV